VIQSRASREFDEGLRNIERAIVDGVLRKCGKNVDASQDLTWPGEFREPPETIVLSVRKGGRKIDQTFDRVEVEESRRCRLRQPHDAGGGREKSPNLSK